MKLRVRVFKTIAFFLVSLTVIGCSDLVLNKKSLNAFSESFIAANESRDVEAMLELFALEDADQKTINLLRIAVEFEIGLPIESLVFESLSGAPEEIINYTHNGISYEPSLKPKYRMKVQYDVEGQLASKYTLGRNIENDWRIVTAVPKN
jgi:hypothetical protein